MYKVNVLLKCTNTEKEKIITDLKKVETVKQVFDYINSNFEIENCNLRLRFC